MLRFGGDANDKQMTTCLRATFEVSDPAPVQFLALQVLVDDGIVAYLNGEEILRDNLPDGQIDSDTRALRSVEKKSIGFLVPVESLHRGKNVLAAEIHQWSPTSSDLAFDLEVRADRGIDWVETAKTLEEADFKLPANLRDEFERR